METSEIKTPVSEYAKIMDYLSQRKVYLTEELSKHKVNGTCSPSSVNNPLLFGSIVYTCANLLVTHMSKHEMLTLEERQPYKPLVELAHSMTLKVQSLLFEFYDNVHASLPDKSRIDAFFFDSDSGYLELVVTDNANLKTHILMRCNCTVSAHM